jgi:hypothetical protein
MCEYFIFVNHTILHKIGVVSKVAGSIQGFEDGELNDAKFNGLFGIAVDSASGDIYVADKLNHSIRKISSGTYRK